MIFKLALPLRTAVFVYSVAAIAVTLDKSLQVSSEYKKICERNLPLFHWNTKEINLLVYKQKGSSQVISGKRK